MKLAVGVNIFGDYKRQTLALQVLQKQAQKFKEITLYNITFEGETNKNSDFIHLPLLKRNAASVIKNSESKKPISKDFFDILAQQDCDSFLFLNSDVLLTSKVIRLILDNEFETYSFSRADCYEFDDPTKAIPYRIEIAGFDAWSTRKAWWEQNRNLFKDYIYAEHLWDVAFAVTMFKHSKGFLGNKEIFLAHEKHPINWNEHSLEAVFNTNLWNTNDCHEKWHEFIFKNLIHRTPYGQFLTPLDNEEELERFYLK